MTKAISFRGLYPRHSNWLKQEISPALWELWQLFSMLLSSGSFPGSDYFPFMAVRSGTQPKTQGTPWILDIPSVFLFSLFLSLSLSLPLLLYIFFLWHSVPWILTSLAFLNPGLDLLNSVKQMCFVHCALLCAMAYELPPGNRPSPLWPFFGIMALYSCCPML